MRYDQVSYVPPLTKITKILISLCAGMYFLALVLRGIAGIDLNDTFGLIPSDVWEHGKVWQLVTYIFLHGNAFHLLLNLMILWFFGAEIEMRMGEWKFLQYFFLCGIGAGLFNVFVKYGLIAMGSVEAQATVSNAIIGASGALFGLLVAYGVFFSDRYLLLFFMFPLKAPYFVMVIAGMELLLGLEGRQGDNVAHFAHLGGALIGAAYLWWHYIRPRSAKNRGNREREDLKKRFTLIVNEGKDAETRRGDDPNFWN
ncbi:rhomboid family intramembrane serine protease [bacterium]|nr:rhomboid family intramembrane serine protease [bacterium]